VRILFAVDCCLFLCKSRLDVMMDFIKRVDAVPFKSLILSIKLKTKSMKSNDFQWIDFLPNDGMCRNNRFRFSGVGIRK
jgi:hypothetical protein